VSSEPELPVDAEWIVVRRPSSGIVAEELALVLASAGIPHRLADDVDGRRLEVLPGDRARAEETLAAYDAESAPPPEAPALSAHGARWLGAATVAVLVAIFALQLRDPSLTRAGAAIAERLLDGEPWRAVTAFTLHGDWMHLFGNCVSALIVVGAVGWWVGPGLGALLLVAAGALANFGVAVVLQRHHSVGASTIVFAAMGLLGVLSAIAAIRRARVLGSLRERRRAWVIVAACLALLGLLGGGGSDDGLNQLVGKPPVETAARVDVFAHLFGMLAGALVGVVPALLLRRPARPLLQALFGGIALVTLIASWALALSV
jgi:membrane associated rhomboid family serine protease